jgi:hypothetical protein
MEQVVCDVKPIDIVMRRPDGSEVWPKFVAFMDTGTHRVFGRFYMLPKGQGIRQEHVIETFMAMVAHPQWGLPQQLYRDNGTEFAVFDKIKSALELVQEAGGRTIVNAKPYSGASKPIESKFAMLDRTVFNQFPGWAGGNRMNKKTQTVGKPPAPYPHHFERFIAEAEKRIADFESVELRSGPFKGRSPEQIYADHVAAGWRPVSVHPAALSAAFWERRTRLVDKGVVSIDGTRYRHPELARLNRRTVTVAVSWQRGAWPVVELPELGWAYLEPEMYHLPGTVDGAIESGRLQRDEVRTIGAMRRLAKPVAVDVLDDRVTALPTRAAPAPLIDVMLSDAAEGLAAGWTEAEERRAAAPDAAELRRRHRMAITEALEASYAKRA